MSRLKRHVVGFKKVKKVQTASPRQFMTARLSHNIRIADATAIFQATLPLQILCILSSKLVHAVCPLHCCDNVVHVQCSIFVLRSCERFPVEPPVELLCCNTLSCYTLSAEYVLAQGFPLPPSDHLQCYDDRVRCSLLGLCSMRVCSACCGRCVSCFKAAHSLCCARIGASNGGVSISLLHTP